ncbi:MAG TPA: glycosyltransferase family 39 protein [Pirellulales bacterium]|nr:glycosyltransferase family 39 protein [Pirellulales bacterium]
MSAPPLVVEAPPRQQAKQLPLRRPGARILLGIGGAVLLAAALRFPQFTTRSIWFDEAASWQQSSLPARELLHRLRFDTVLPPFFLLLKGWMAAFGESAASLRGFSVLFGLLAVAGMYLFAFELYLLSRAANEGRRTARGSMNAQWFALAVALMVATSPFQINAAIEVRMYAPGTAAVALSSWLLLRALRSGAWRWWLAYGASAGVTQYLHPYLLFSVAGQFAALFGLIAARFWRGKRRRAQSLAGRAGAAGALAAAMFLPGLPMFLAEHRMVHKGFWIAPLDAQLLADTFAQFVQPVDPPYGALRQVEAIGLTSVLLASVFVVAWRARRGDWMLIVSAAFPLAAAGLASLKTPIWEGRYFRFAHLFLLALIALAAWRLLARWPGVRAGLLLLLVWGNTFLAFDFWRSRQIETCHGMRGAMERVLASIGPGELVVAESHLHFVPAKFYAGSQARVRLVGSMARGRWARQFIPADDFIDNDQLERSLETGVWFIGHGPLDRFESSFDVPALHRVKVTETFVERYDHGVPDWPIWVFHCFADRQAPSP